MWFVLFESTATTVIDTCSLTLSLPDALPIPRLGRSAATRHERDERAPSLRPFAPSAGAQAPVYRGARAEPDRCIFMRTDSTSTSACRRRVLRVPEIGRASCRERVSQYV